MPAREPWANWRKIRQFADKLQNTISKLSNITDRLDAGEGTAGKLLHDPSLYNNSDANAGGDALSNQGDQEDPKRYLTIHFKIF